MSIDPEEHERALTAVREQSKRRLLAVVGVVVVVLFATVAAGWTLVVRAQEAAPDVIQQIAIERQAVIEARITARSNEAQQLAGELFGFLLEVWEKNEAMRGVRDNVEGATTQMRLLTGELNSALDSPTRNLGALLENGPTRARAVLDYAIAAANELGRLVPMVLGALNQAKTAADQTHGPALQAILEAMDALLNPFIGTDNALAGQWKTVRTGLLEWTNRVFADLDFARSQMSGDELSSEFMRRLRDAVL